MTDLFTAINRRARCRRRLVGCLPGWAKVLLRRGGGSTAFPAEGGDLPSVPDVDLLDAPTRPGYNWVGFASAENGIGQGQRYLMQAAVEAREEVASLDVSYLCPARARDRTWAHLPSELVPGRRTLFHFNAPETAEVLAVFGPGLYRVGYNIGYWVYELPRLPPDWVRYASLLREIWTPSRFSADAIAAAVEVPVKILPHPVHVPPPLTPADVLRARRELGLPATGTLFGFLFDVNSSMERKNPAAAMRAFCEHVRSDDDAWLVVKANAADRLRGIGGDGSILRYLEHERVILIDEVWPRARVDRFLDAIDCLLSLHRAEGFGLVLAEAMARGKAVIATDWSGNTDYLDAEDGYPVRCDIVTIDRDHGPYPAGGTWADPDVDHAGELLRRVLDDPEGARRIGVAARARIVDTLSPAAIGRRLVTTGGDGP